MAVTVSTVTMGSATLYIGPTPEWLMRGFVMQLDCSAVTLDDRAPVSDPKEN